MQSIAILCNVHTLHNPLIMQRTEHCNANYLQCCCSVQCKSIQSGSPTHFQAVDEIGHTQIGQDWGEWDFLRFAFLNPSWQNETTLITQLHTLRCLRRSERYFNSVPIHCNKLKWWHFRDPTMHPTKTSQPVPWSGLSADPYTIGKCHYPLMTRRWQMCLYTLYIQEVSSSNEHNPQSWQL